MHLCQLGHHDALGLDQGDGVLFLPDANLGRNTARTLGIAQDRIERLDIRGQGRFIQAAEPARDVYLWPGLCAVHAKFHADRIEAIRRYEPEALVLVHPECHPDVVALADGSGSTSYLIKAVAEAPAGSMIYVGTEWNLVERLAKRHADRTVQPLRTALCSNMAKSRKTTFPEPSRTWPRPSPCRSKTTSPNLRALPWSACSKRVDRTTHHDSHPHENRSPGHRIGIAGCTAALCLADMGREVTLLSSGSALDNGNTALAQGGIVYTGPDDTPEKLARDITTAGWDYNYRMPSATCAKTAPRPWSASSWTGSRSPSTGSKAVNTT